MSFSLFNGCLVARSESDLYTLIGYQKSKMADKMFIINVIYINMIIDKTMDN